MWPWKKKTAPEPSGDIHIATLRQVVPCPNGGGLQIKEAYLWRYYESQRRDFEKSVCHMVLNPELSLSTEDAIQLLKSEPPRELDAQCRGKRST